MRLSHVSRRSFDASAFALGLLCASASLAADGPGLVDAARNGDVDAVRSLLKGGADPNQAAPDGSTAVHWAVHGDNLAMLNALLDAGAKPDGVTRYRIAPLTLAAQNGNAALVERLLDCWRQSRYGVRRRTDGAHDRGAQRQRRCGARAAEARRAGRPGGILPRADGADVRRGRGQHGRRQAAARVRCEAERALQGRLHAAALRRAQQPVTRRSSSCWSRAPTSTTGYPTARRRSASQS